MSGTTISSAASVGIVLTAASEMPLLITETGSVFANGYYASAVYSAIDTRATIVNAGILNGGGYGINLHNGGRITNGSPSALNASISGGYDGILAGARARVSVTNFGTIASTNFTSGSGVNAGGDATVSNGASGATAATISGYFEGVFIGGANATVTNMGTIIATGTSSQLGESSIGVYLRTGGQITNGSARHTAATISAPDFGVEVAHAPGVVNNFGTITGTGPLGRGVLLISGGIVRNGSAQDTAAYINAESKNGVYAGGTIASAVTNFGTITGGKNGVALQNGGTVVNGSRTDTTARISGARQGVYIEGRVPSMVANSGTITSSNGFWGVSIYLRGSVWNGSTANSTALISGGGGIYNGGIANVTNYGRILGTTRPGIELKSGGAVTNFGTISSANGTAIYFGNSDSRLAMTPTAQFGGKVLAGSGNNTLQLMPGGVSGTLSGLGSSFVNFSNIAVDSGADWTLTGTHSVSALAVRGTLNLAGSVTVSGTLNPAPGGLVALGASATIEVNAVLGTGPAISFLNNNTLIVDEGAAFGQITGPGPATGPLLRNFHAGDAVDLRDLPLAGVIVLDYFSQTGELQIGHGSGTPAAALFFESATLGNGFFQLAPDGVGGTLLTRS